MVKAAIAMSCAPWRLPPRSSALLLLSRPRSQPGVFVIYHWFQIHWAVNGARRAAPRGAEPARRYSAVEGQLALTVVSVVTN